MNDISNTFVFANFWFLLFSLLFFVLPLAYWPELFEAASLPRYFLISIFTSLSLLLWLISSNVKNLNWHPGFTLILVFFGWAAISTTWSPDAGTSLIDIVQLFSLVILAFLSMQMSHLQVQTYLVPAVLGGATLAALIGIGQNYGLNPLEFRMIPGSFASTFINPNHAAVYFDFIPPLSFAAMLHYQSRIVRWLAASILGLSLAFLWVNSSRGSLLALVICFLVLLSVILLNPLIRKHIVPILRHRYREILLAIFIPLLVVFSPSESSEKQTPDWNITSLEGQADRSTNMRLAMYINSLPAILEQPLTGLGYGGMRVGFQSYTSRLLPLDNRTEDTVTRELHNDPLQFFVELGLPGGLLAITIYLIVIRTGWQALTAKGADRNQILLLGFWLGLISCGIHALVDFPLRLPTSAAMFWLSAGILLGFSKPEPIRLLDYQNRAIRMALALVGIISLFFYVPFYSSYLSANHDLYNAIVYLKKNKCVEAAQASEDGLQTFASDFMLQTVHAQIYTFCNFSHEQKLIAMNRVLTLDPTNMRARLTRGILYNDANKPELAIPELIKVAEILPHRPYAYAGLGDSARLQGDVQRALHYYRAAQKRKPDYKYVERKLEELDSSFSKK